MGVQMPAELRKSASVNRRKSAPSLLAVLRLVDANANRALEGLRVCEDVVRFHHRSSRLFGRLRRLRHAVASAVRRLPVRRVELAAARASRQDIGRAAKSSRVQSLDQLVVINFQRTKESLRTLEECSRVLAPGLTPIFQRLRFNAYDTERDCLLRVAALRHS